MFTHIKKHLYFYFLFSPSLFLFAQNKIPTLKQNKILTLNQTWNKAIDYSKKINISNLEIDASKEEIEEVKRERFPEIALKGNYEYATNIPVYEDGLNHSPTQHEVIHLLYKVSTEYYFNVYNGNKLNLSIDKKK